MAVQGRLHDEPSHSSSGQDAVRGRNEAGCDASLQEYCLDEQRALEGETTDRCNIYYPLFKRFNNRMFLFLDPSNKLCEWWANAGECQELRDHVWRQMHNRWGLPFFGIFSHCLHSSHTLSQFRNWLPILRVCNCSILLSNSPSRIWVIFWSISLTGSWLISSPNFRITASLQGCCLQGCLWGYRLQSRKYQHHWLGRIYCLCIKMDRFRLLPLCIVYCCYCWTRWMRRIKKFVRCLCWRRSCARVRVLFSIWVVAEVPV
jgi:hypothetical protein